MKHRKSAPLHAVAAGFTLPAILVVVGAVLILAVGILIVAGIERSTARSFVDRQRAELAARTALEDIRGIFTTQALKRPGSTTLFSSKNFPGAISDHLVCKRDFVAKNPEKIQKIVNAWFATQRDIKANPAPALAILAKRAGVSEAEYRAYDAGTTIYTLEQNRQVVKPGTTMTSLPYAAAQISGFLQAVGLAKTAPQLDGLFDSKFVDAAN
jgi:NitT/TauT family transport system substrate-binding protein